LHWSVCQQGQRDSHEEYDSQDDTDKEKLDMASLPVSYAEAAVFILEALLKQECALVAVR
jgi:hypothetical protein